MLDNSTGLITGTPATSTMNEHDYQKMFEMENHYWWFIGRRKLVDWLISRYSTCGGEKLLFDLGCGTGQNLQYLSRHGKVVGGDCAVAALDFCCKRNLKNVFGCRAEALPLRSDSADVVTALDVLEHIREDMTAMEEVYRILKPGGLFVTLVPAYGFLWSEHDEALNHVRRYVAGELRAKQVASGFVLERVTYFIFFLFLPISCSDFGRGSAGRPYPRLFPIGTLRIGSTSSLFGYWVSRDTS